MYTQCPACRTIFEIDEDALQASLGIVRCGHCEQRFDALRTLSDSLPAGPEAALPEQNPEARTPTLTAAVSPAALQNAAAPRRKHTSATAAPAGGPASDAESAPAKPVAPPVPPSAPPATWFPPALDERTRALIADAAGIPHEAIGVDPDWQVIDIPEPPGSGELDIIPLAPDDAAATVDEAPTSPVPGAPRASGVITVVEPDHPDTPQPALAGFPRDRLVPRATDAAPNHAGIITVVEPARPAAPTSAAASPAVSAVASGEPGAANAAPVDAGSLPTAVETAATESDAAAANAPVYVPPRQRRIHPHDWLWGLGCLLLTVSLAAQLAWANRVSLMRDPATQPTVLAVCAHLRCDMPPIRDIGKLELLSRDVRPDPKTAGALLITATVRNNARFAQPWPVVVVQLTDIDNAPVAMRRFRPAQYLPDAARRAAGLAAGTTAAVAFEVADPGPRAVAFHFSFD